MILGTLNHTTADKPVNIEIQTKHQNNFHSFIINYWEPNNTINGH